MHNLSNKIWSFSFYFLFFAGAAAIYNYYALFFLSRGIPESQIGVLMAAASLVGLFSGPLLSGLADATRRHRMVLTLAIAGNALAIVMFPAGDTFAVFLMLMLVQSLFGGPIMSMVDNATMTMLGDERDRYGRVRIGGTFGWGLAALVMGLVVERTGLRWNFAIYSTLLLIGLLVVQQLRFSHRPAEGSFFGGVRTLLTDRKWITFLLTVFIAGCGNAAVTGYLFVYLQRIGTAPALMGVAIAISTAAELPALFFANRMMGRFGSRGLLTLGLIVSGLRCALYGLIDVPWMALTVQLLQFGTFPILLVAGVSYAHENAPPGMGATAQSIFGSAFLGFGFAAGGLLGGVLIEHIGVQSMFLTFGALLLLAALIFGVARRRRRVAVGQPA